MDCVQPGGQFLDRRCLLDDGIRPICIYVRIVIHVRIVDIGIGWRCGSRDLGIVRVGRQCGDGSRGNWERRHGG